jgi:RNA ligase (TIGR02306 family)
VIKLRKLASIQTITVEDIPKADRVQLGKVLGWTTIVQKNQFKSGDKIVFFEIDSLFPEKPEYEFMRKFHFRIRTMKSPKLGVISQGLALSLAECGLSEKLEVGTDVTELLGVTKYEAPIPMNMTGIVKGSFPSFILKSDETRVQVLQEVLTRYKGTDCYVTEKLDGTSFTCYLRDGEFGVCSRNLELKLGEENKDNIYVKTALKLELETKLKALGKNICIQGELVGKGIAKNYLEIEDYDIYFFNVFDIDACKYYSYAEFVDFVNKLGLKTVPILEEHYVLDNNIEALVNRASGRSVICSRAKREGIVIRPLIEKLDLMMNTGFSSGRVSFKAINNEYLLEMEQ